MMNDVPVGQVGINKKARKNSIRFLQLHCEINPAFYRISTNRLTFIKLHTKTKVQKAFIREAVELKFVYTYPHTHACTRTHTHARVRACTHTIKS